MTPIAIAANRGDIGGGELMQLRLAGALVELGYDVRVVAPSTPGDLAHAAVDAGLGVDVISCRDRATYARGLRRWDRGRVGLLWCNGLLPALATAGHRRRLVHLHQQPLGSQRGLARVARIGAAATIVPSAYLRRLVPGSAVLPNWTDDLEQLPPRPPADTVTVGSIGRIGREKGTDVLAAACRLLPDEVRRRVRLVVAGDDRFVPVADRRVVDAALSESGVRVERPGWVEPAAFYAAVDVAVFASVRPESFGLAAAEAMGAGRPVVVSDAGGLPEVAGTGHPWVAPAGDAGALSRVLGEAIAALPATDVVQRQRARWEREFSPPAGLRHLEELLRALVRDDVLEAVR